MKEGGAVRPWEVRFLDLKRQVDDMFESLIYRPWAIGGQTTWRPALDLHETKDAYVVEVDLPGVAAEDVRIVVSERHLAVAGQRQSATPEGTLFNHCERQCGVFHRSLDFPQAVDPEQAKAEFHQGICRIVLPKRQPEAGKAVEGSSGAGHSQWVVQVTVR